MRINPRRSTKLPDRIVLDVTVRCDPNANAPGKRSRKYRYKRTSPSLGAASRQGRIIMRCAAGQAGCAMAMVLRGPGGHGYDKGAPLRRSEVEKTTFGMLARVVEFLKSAKRFNLGEVLRAELRDYCDKGRPSEIRQESHEKSPSKPCNHW